jgi:hypothetical protein
VKFDNTTGRLPTVANSAQSQITRELAPLSMNFSVLVHFTHLGKSVQKIWNETAVLHPIKFAIHAAIKKQKPRFT